MRTTTLSALLAASTLLSPCVLAQSTLEDHERREQQDHEELYGIADRLIFYLMILESIGEVEAATERAELLFSVEPTVARDLVLFSKSAVERYRVASDIETKKICDIEPSPNVREEIIDAVLTSREAMERLQLIILRELQQRMKSDSYQRIVTELKATMSMRTEFNVESLRDPQIDLYERSRIPCEVGS